MWDFCNARAKFPTRRIGARFCVFHVARLQQGRGRHMSIDTLVLILISTLAVAGVLNRLDMRRL
jgi:hypothetical protein